MLRREADTFYIGELFKTMCSRNIDFYADVKTFLIVWTKWLKWLSDITDSKYLIAIEIFCLQKLFLV